MVTERESLQSQQRLFENTAILLVGEIVSQAANFVFVVALARIFGRELLGTYAFSMSIGALLSVLVTLGTRTLLLRQLSRDPDRSADVTGALLPFQLSMAVMLIFATYISARFLDDGESVTLVVTLIVAYHVLITVTRLFLVAYMAREEMAPATGLPIARRLLILMLAGFAMIAGQGPELTLAALPISALAILGLSGFLSSRRFGRPVFRFRVSEICNYLVEARSFFHIVLVSTLYMRAGIIFLAIFAGAEATGLFASAERLVIAVNLGQTMFLAALFPLVSRLWNSDPGQFEKMVRRGGRVVLLLTLPIATLIALFAREIIQFLYGDTFAEASVVLAGIVWVLVVRGVTQLLGVISQAANHQHLLLRSKLLGLIMLTFLSVLLIPRYGAFGLVGALFVGELASAASNFAALRGLSIPLPRLHDALRTGAACLLAAFTAYATVDFVFWLRLVAVLITGGVSLWVFGAVRNHDLAYLWVVAQSRGKQ